MGGYYDEHRPTFGADEDDNVDSDTSKLPTPYAVDGGLNTSELQQPYAWAGTERGISPRYEGERNQFDTREIPTPYPASNVFDTISLPEPQRLKTSREDTTRLPRPQRAVSHKVNTQELPKPERFHDQAGTARGRSDGEHNQFETREMAPPYPAQHVSDTMSLEEPQRFKPSHDDTNRLPRPERFLSHKVDTQGLPKPERFHDPDALSEPARFHDQNVPRNRYDSEQIHDKPAHPSVDSRKMSDRSHGAMSKGILITALLLRVCEGIFLAAGIALIVSYSKSYPKTTFTFSSFTATRYALAVAVIGLLYSVVETFSIIVRLASGRFLLPGVIHLYISSIADQVIMVLLMTGGAAAASILKNFDELLSILESGSFCNTVENFCSQMGSGVGAIFLASVFYATSFSISCFCLHKKRF
ncbi:hypothetical protein KP509_28G066100 [Ceratopteris richardii]|uniref:CASP-like protein n=1 Tax=Ceratopteris richardii TaxID=49495 RepID=A0A8T2REZ6_CERRI|nr:hypothetical protein KP509_28G066100 [Ceratopteris richardii]